MVKIHSDEEQLKKILKGIYQPETSKVDLAKKKRKKVLLLSGPTGVGKTSLSLRIASSLKGEIISADSMQVYRGMDIGTAKVTLQERSLAPHHLIDIRDVRERFTVVDFFHESKLACDAIHARDSVPIVVGGTGFYIHVFLYGPPSGPPSQKQLRQRLEEDMEKFSPEAMYDRLQKIDPEYAKTITRHDRVKIIRALEIITLTQDKVSHLAWNKNHTPIDYDVHCWFLYRSREHIYNRIEERCEAMLKEGLVGEVSGLEKEGLLENLSASKAIGYRQILDYLKSDQSEQDYDLMKQQFKKASRQYAKRQFTWFRKEPEFRWLDLDVHDKEIAADIIIQDFMRNDILE
ncbi:MAG: tRNA dimethylallyltransferase [Chlamydiae bacterium]|nr:tRNA dimethylallyltransferase [Chlamydiota bacterium]